MTWKQIEAAREIRLWMGQVVIPAVVAVGTVMAIPEAREAVTSKANSIKESVRKMFKKEEA